MKVNAIVALAFSSCIFEISAFIPCGARRVSMPRNLMKRGIRMNSEPLSTTDVEDVTEEVESVETFVSSSPSDTSSISSAIVSINEENVEFGAGVVGGVAGLILGGPLLAVAVSVAANFSSKQDNDIGVVMRGISKTAIEAFNFLLSINSKYDLSGKAGSAVEGAVSKLKETDDSKSIENIEATLKETTSKATQLAAEYDLLAKGKQVLGTVGELADSAIIKTVELEKEYKVIDKVTESVKKAVDTTKSSL